MSTQANFEGIPVDSLPLRLAIARAWAGGISAREAALRVGVSGQTWRNWESGQTAGAEKPAMMSYIAQQLEVDASWLRNGGPLATANPRPDGPDGGVADECAIRDSNPKPAD